MNYFYQLLIGLFSGAFAAWVTTYFALRRFYSEKWWEKRATAFVELTDAVYQCKLLQEYYSELRECRRHECDNAPNFVELSDHQLQEMQILVSNARQLMAKYSQVGPLLITEKATELLRSYFREEQKCEHDVHFRGWETDEAEEYLLKMTQQLFDNLIIESKHVLRAG